MARLDPHSYNDNVQVETERLALLATVDFATRTLACEATLAFRAPGSGTLDLDTRDLTIESVEAVDASWELATWKSGAVGTAIPFTLHPTQAIFGARLSIELPAGTAAIRVRYRTSPEASALQWLEPSQTSGKQLPFLFTQCQAIHARSVVPCQDSSRVRMRFVAELVVPKAMRAVMAAAPVSRVERGDVAVERYEMPQPIPSYLFAFAVGDLASQDLSARSRVWAEPAMLERAAYEFGTVEDMMVKAEALYGTYDWERFDLLTMPPSFPYGGMENPRLTFVTPTVIAGDRSLVNLIAHELAHSWTGNLVTNASVEHFWLNEGFTVYAERRIVEAIYGTEDANLQAALGRRELDESVARFADRPALTKLRTELAGIDPDDAYSQIPYQKGASLLMLLEATVGRKRFDPWLRDYLNAFRYRSITTDDFVGHFEKAFPGVLAQVGAPRWIDGEGIPENAPRPVSKKLEAIEAVGDGLPSMAQGSRWSATEWHLYLDGVKRPASAELLATLDDRYSLTRSTNYEILVAWLSLALSSGYHEVVPRAEQVLETVGRMKYLRPLYGALHRDPATKDRAKAVFERAKAGYHPIARGLVQQLLTS